MHLYPKAADWQDIKLSDHDRWVINVPTLGRLVRANSVATAMDRASYIATTGGYFTRSSTVQTDMKRYAQLRDRIEQASRVYIMRCIARQDMRKVYEFACLLYKGYYDLHAKKSKRFKSAADLNASVLNRAQWGHWGLKFTRDSSVMILQVLGGSATGVAFLFANLASAGMSAQATWQDTGNGWKALAAGCYGVIPILSQSAINYRIANKTLNVTMAAVVATAENFTKEMVLSKDATLQKATMVGLLSGGLAATFGMRGTNLRHALTKKIDEGVTLLTRNSVLNAGAKAAAGSNIAGKVASDVAGKVQEETLKTIAMLNFQPKQGAVHIPGPGKTVSELQAQAAVRHQVMRDY